MQSEPGLSSVGVALDVFGIARPVAVVSSPLVTELYASVMYCIVVIIEVGLYFTLYRFVAFGIIGSRHARALLPTSFPSKIWP
jgi:hypothetical protein